jgi:alkanesulfonate monooxygenase SsuD/methylene tetrahydromethanopterin reductase-like flavin-dependent oxidoreductase (luciferase family)
MYGIPMAERGPLVTALVATLKDAFTGEPFSYQGRIVHLTPAPFRSGGPAIFLGGSSEAAARRAARIADGFLPSVAEVWDFYRDEVLALGRPDPGPCPVPANQVVVALAEDPEAGWTAMAPYFLHEMNAYGTWQAQDAVATPYRKTKDIEELRQGGQYRVVTPEQFVAELRAAPFAFAMLHPLCGGMPMDLAWSSLELFERRVLPAFQD